MEFSERERLLRRISSGKLYCSIKFQYETYDVVFVDPSLDLMAEADWHTKRILDENKSSGSLITFEESQKILKEDGVWSTQFEEELDGLAKDLKELQSKLNTLKFHKAQQRAVLATIEQGKKRIIELETIKNQLWATTIDYFVDNSRRRFIVSKITKNLPDDLLQNQAILDTLTVCYYKENSISESQMREIARTDPWRLYWIVSKDTGTSLFRGSAVDFTDLQYLLIMWSRVYDFCYQSPNRPTDEVINDDLQFDAWYKTECQRIDKESRANANEQSLPNGIFGQEVFIPADSEGAAEVYDLNNQHARMKIKERQKVIEQKGSVIEAELPDVKKELIMMGNKMASNATISRSK